MLRRLLIISLAASLIGLASPRPAHAGHFIAEGSVGIMNGLSSGDTDPGAYGSFLLGVGGRPKGGLLRYFLILEAAFGGYTRTHVQNFRSITLDRSLFDVGLGGRIVVPLFTEHVRLFLDVLIVAVGASTDFDGEFLAESGSSEVDGGLRLATGLQWRPIDLLSVGVRVSMTSAFGEFDGESGRGWLVGFESESGHYDLAAAITLYF